MSSINSLPRTLGALTCWAACLLLLHSPDGEELWIRAEAIVAVKPVAKAYYEHLAKNTHSIIYDGKPRGIRETAEAVINMIKSCDANAR